MFFKSIFSLFFSLSRWLTANPLNTVYLDCPSFGYEHIFLALSSRFNMPIHISPWRMKSYSVLPEVQQSLTLDGEMTRIHSCGYNVIIVTLTLGVLLQFLCFVEKIEKAWIALWV